jgi:molybdopterin molybdotransferase
MCGVSRKVESHMITALAGANAIIEAPPSPEPVHAGMPVTCTLLPWQVFSSAATPS